MMQIEQIRNFFPPALRNSPAHQKYILKEYLQLLILDYLTTTPAIRKLALIGGTNLRLCKGIDRFSEDLHFDCENLGREEFMEMTDAIIVYLQRSGWHVRPGDKSSEKLKAFRRNLYFPELLFDLRLSGYKEERFLIKVECEDQQVDYQPVMTTIKGCGMYFSFPVPGDPILCAMKISALLSRHKGRDFYDCMFLLGQTDPDYTFLSARHSIRDLPELKSALGNLLNNTNLSHKAKDFEHLLFNKENSKKILLMADVVASLCLTP